MVLLGLDKDIDKFNEASRKLDEAAHGVAGKSEKVMLQELINIEKRKEENAYLQNLTKEEQEEYWYQKNKANRWNDWGAMSAYHKEKQRRKNGELEKEKQFSMLEKEKILFKGTGTTIIASRYLKFLGAGVIALVYGGSAFYVFVTGKIDSGFLFLAIAFVAFIIGVPAIFIGFRVRSMENRYRKYLSIIFNEKVNDTSKIAKALGEQTQTVEDDLERMFRMKYVSGHVNRATHKVHLSKTL